MLIKKNGFPKFLPLAMPVANLARILPSIVASRQQNFFLLLFFPQKNSFPIFLPLGSAMLVANLARILPRIFPVGNRNSISLLFQITRLSSISGSIQGGEEAGVSSGSAPAAAPALPPWHSPGGRPAGRTGPAAPANAGGAVAPNASAEN